MLIPLGEADRRCGVKAANLGRLLREGFAVPGGLVIVDAFDNSDWVDELGTALRGLGGIAYAVRSSGMLEDGAQASFAGLLRTALDVTTPAHVAREVELAAASGTGPLVAAYASRTINASEPGVVPVIVQSMIEARVAGVMFTRHPATMADEVVIEAIPGLGDALVGGRVTPQRWVVAGDRIDRDLRGAPLLTAREIASLVALGRRIEAAFGYAQDIEWAIADDIQWILQTRPITVTPEPPRARAGSARSVLLRGTPASPGVASGRVRIIHSLDDFDEFAAGDVLVCRSTSPAWTPLLARAVAVVTEIGGMLSHAAIVAREFRIPAITAAEGAMDLMVDGSRVEVDGAHGTVSVTSHGGAALELRYR